MAKRVPKAVSGFFKNPPPEVLAYMRAWGRKGGKIGGKRSLETMTPEARIARARAAGLASVAAKRAAKAKKAR